MNCEPYVCGNLCLVDTILLWLRRIYVFPIRLYRLCLSPYFGTQCRFYPTCSVYAIEAVMMHGIFKGTVLAAWRIVRCNPWSQGGYDPVPPVKSGFPAPTYRPAHSSRGLHILDGLYSLRSR